MSVDETLTSDLHHCDLNSGNQINVKAGIMTCQGMGSGWNHFSSLYGKPCMFKSVRHLVIKNISIHNKQLCKSACLNMYMKLPANGSPRGTASNLENFVSIPNSPSVV